MNNSGIKLDMDMADISFVEGTAKSISSGNSEDYVSRVDIVLPVAFREIPVGEYSIGYNNTVVTAIISTINEKEDPVFNAARNIKIGASGSGLEFIPFEAYSDNRGVYPATLVTLIFPMRIASWIDDSHETGMKMDFDYEQIEITGIPDNKEKIQAILVLNRLIKSLNIESLNSVLYDDITMFMECYFKKLPAIPLVRKVNALVSKDAYKNAVYDYVLPNIRESEASRSFSDFQVAHANKQISCELDLKSAVEDAIQGVLKHNIESRRWIEPFWDGQRNVNHNGVEITVPRMPKGETKIQPTLHVILDMALSPLGIHVTRESDEGVGTMDFLFHFTTNDRKPLSVGIEFKVAHHKEIKKGISQQLPAYLKAIRSTSGIFVVMWFKDSKFFKEPNGYEKEKMEIFLDEQSRIISLELGINLSATMLDASIRPSASNLS